MRPDGTKMVFLLTLCAGVLIAALCVGGSSLCGQSVPVPESPICTQNNRVLHRTWQVGVFGMGGWPPYYAVHSPQLHYSEDIRFFSAGVEAGRMLTKRHGPGFLRGRFESVVELMPYWQEHAPDQMFDVYLAGHSTPAFIGGFSAYDQHGISLVPALARWNFTRKAVASKVTPWLQVGTGILWTTKNFPQGEGEHDPKPYTSRFNFTPQVDIGENVFIRDNQSIDFSVRAIHYTSFGLGEYDPGVNVAVEFSVGYSWWK